MVRRRAIATRRKLYTNRKYGKARRRAKLMRMPRAPRRALVYKHDYVRTATYAPVYYETSNASMDDYWGGGRSFQLNDLPSFSEFQNLYDAYVIKGIKVMFYFTSGTLQFADTYFRLGAIRMIHRVDKDDATAPAGSAAGWASLAECAYSKITLLPGRTAGVIKAYFKPHVLTPTYVSSLLPNTWGYSDSSKKIDMANPDVPHYGYKWVLWIAKEALGANDVKFRMDMSAKFYIRCYMPQ